MHCVPFCVSPSLICFVFCLVGLFVVKSITCSWTQTSLITCVVIKTTHLCQSRIQRQAEHAEFIFKVFLKLNVHDNIVISPSPTVKAECFEETGGGQGHRPE